MFKHVKVFVLPGKQRPIYFSYYSPSSYERSILAGDYIYIYIYV